MELQRLKNRQRALRRKLSKARKYMYSEFQIERIIQEIAEVGNLIAIMQSGREIIPESQRYIGSH